MRIIKPKALQRGDIIGICAPSSPPSSPQKIQKGITYLESLGYRIEIGKNVYAKRGYLAGTDIQRASDLNALFGNPKAKAIFTVRGGYGVHRILPFLNYPLIKQNPKILVGYSDITALELALFTKTKLVTFSGPMVSVEMASDLSGATEESFWRFLTHPEPPNPLHFKKESPLKDNRNRFSNGRLLGGNLSLINSILGTTYFPSLSDCILLLEEIDERPYRIDRMLQQLKLAGTFKKINGIVWGKFINCNAEKGKPSLSLRQIMKDTFQQFVHPILEDIPYGHIKNSLTLPIGIRVQLDSTRNSLTFLEGSVV